MAVDACPKLVTIRATGQNISATTCSFRPVATRCLERNGHDDGLPQDPNAIGTSLPIMSGAGRDDDALSPYQYGRTWDS